MNRKRVFKILASCLMMVALTGCACSDSRKPTANPKDTDSDQDGKVAAVGSFAVQDVKKATARVKGIDNSKVQGLVTFTVVPGGVKVVADVDGLSPGKHGFHVHEHGDCGGIAGAAAGGHFNPTNKKHGGPDDADRHAGDLGNIVADASGHAHYERIDNIISLNGKDTIVGRCIMIHADEDDLKTQPTGNSGARIGCGLIEAAN